MPNAFCGQGIAGGAVLARASDPRKERDPRVRYFAIRAAFEPEECGLGSLLETRAIVGSGSGRRVRVVKRRLPRRSRRLCLFLGIVMAFGLFVGAPDPVDAQEETIDPPGWWAPDDWDPGTAPSYNGDADDGGCMLRQYDYGTPYWDCKARKGRSGTCVAGDPFVPGDTSEIIASAGMSAMNWDEAFVMCEDPTGTFGCDDSSEGSDCEGGKVRCTNRPSFWKLAGQTVGTDWMHCPPDGFMLIRCRETQGLGFEVGPVQVGDENDGFWDYLNNAGDQYHAVIVPDDGGGPHGGRTRWKRDEDVEVDGEQVAVGDGQWVGDGRLQWWYQEIWEESRADGGKGCSLAKNPPLLQSCTEINDEKEKLRGEIDGLTSQDTLSDPALVAQLPARLAEQESLQADLDRLDSQGGLIPEVCWGEYPSDAYQIHYDAGSSFDPSQWGERLMGWMAEFLFGLGKLLVSASLWLVRLALTFDVTEYRGMVGDFADRLDRQIINLGDDRQLKLTQVAWFALFATAGFLALRNKMGRAGGEILISVVLFGVGTVLMAPDGAYAVGGYFDSAAELVHRSSTGLLLAGHDCDPNAELDAGGIDRLMRGGYECGDADSEDEDWPGFGGVIHEEFVDRPYQYINWGTESLTGPCLRAHRNLLGYGGVNSGYASRYMERQGCAAEAQHSGEMTMGRLMSTVFVMTVAVIISVLLILISATLFVAKFIVAVVFAFLPLAVVAAILPGRGRQIAAATAGYLLQAWGAAALVGFLLALLLLGIRAIHTNTASQSLAHRWAIMLVLTILLWMVFRKLREGAQNAARGISERLTQASGGGSSWSGANAFGGGMDLANVDRAGLAGVRGASSIKQMGDRAASRVGSATSSVVRGGWRQGRQRRAENRSMWKSVRAATMGRELTGDTMPGAHRLLPKNYGRRALRALDAAGPEARGWVERRRVNDSLLANEAKERGDKGQPGSPPPLPGPPGQGSGSGKGGGPGSGGEHWGGASQSPGARRNGGGGGGQGKGGGPRGGVGDNHARVMPAVKPGDGLGPGGGGHWGGAAQGPAGSARADGQSGGGPSRPPVASAKEVRRRLNNDYKQVESVVRRGGNLEGSAWDASQRIGMKPADIASYNASAKDNIARSDIMLRARDGRSNAIAKDRFDRQVANDRTSPVGAGIQSDVQKASQARMVVAEQTIQANRQVIADSPDPNSPWSRAAQENIDKAEKTLEDEHAAAAERNEGERSSRPRWSKRR